MGSTTPSTSMAQHFISIETNKKTGRSSLRPVFYYFYLLQFQGTNPKKARCGVCRRREGVPTVTSSKRKPLACVFYNTSDGAA